MSAKFSIFSLVLFVVLITATLQTYSQIFNGRLIVVNNVGDSYDTTPGDGNCGDIKGHCTLRAAIMESNATAPDDVIVFDIPDPSVITLKLGELPVSTRVVIMGRGARRLTIERDGSPNVGTFRIFNVTGGAHLRGMTIRNGHGAVGGGYFQRAALGLRMLY
ncbi:MAG: hypothetical protein WBO10_03050 [Pyrinomonadaceae bacterium]